MRYEHTLTIVVDSQFPETKESIEHLIQSVLGPWCLSAKVVKLNKEVTPGTKGTTK